MTRTPGRRWPARPTVARAARVAAIATLVIAVVFVGVAAVLDTFLSRRITWEVDQRLGERLLDASHLADPGAYRTLPNNLGTDGAPVFMWWFPAHGSVVPLTNGGPTAPVVRSAIAAAPESVHIKSTVYRVDSIGYRGGELVAAQDLAGPSHIDHILVDGELVLGPVLLLAIFVGALLIGVEAAGPVEAARRHLLEFTADASHELRTPLTVIDAEVELALSSGDDPRTALGHVARESGRLGRIVEDLLWLARADAAPEPEASVPVELATVVAACADRFEPVAASKGLHLEIVVPPAASGSDSSGTWVDGTDTWFDRLCGTLLANSCRYSPPDAIVRASVTLDGSRVALVVEDGGPGVPEAERARLFDRFRRASDHPEGAGLGLAIADAVVRSTGGRWRIGESPLGGARFEVSWKRCAPPTP